MTSNNPIHKPLHRVRNIRNANRNAKRFPQLADYVFDPAQARATRYDLRDPKWQGCGDGGIVAPIGMPAQPNMHQFYNARSNSLKPHPFKSEQEREAHNKKAKTAGFVPFIKNGTDQFKAMMQLGLDPRIPPTEEELRRRAENEAKVQAFRDKMTVATIIENSGGGKWRQKGAFPGWTESLPDPSVVKAIADRKRADQAEAEKKAALRMERGLPRYEV